MAGDVPLEDQVLFQPPGGGAFPAGAAAPALHEYGPALRIGIGSGGPPGAPINDEVLSEAERSGLAAFRLRLSNGYKAAKASRPHADVAWGDASAPRLHLDRQVVIRGAPVTPDPNGPADAPEAKRLAGRVAVGLVFVSGPGPLAMTDAQRQKIVAEVQNGLSYLGGQAPARDVTFAYDFQIAQIDVPDTPGPAPAGLGDNARYEYFEQPWRDAALAAIGYPAGGNGIRNYIRAIKAQKRAQSAYCSFFTHYTLNHFAYCSGSYLTMQYANDGWGPENLDRIFAHETGHVFGAPDEYAESNCDCGGAWGYHQRPNLNCENCADTSVDCIMKRNTWAMCAETPYHLGYTLVGS